MRKAGSRKLADAFEQVERDARERRFGRPVEVSCERDEVRNVRLGGRPEQESERDLEPRPLRVNHLMLHLKCRWAF